MPRFLDRPTPEQQQALDAIQDAYRRGYKPGTRRPETNGLDVLMRDVQPPVPPPSPSEFQVDPLVVGGGPGLAQQAKRLLDLDPATKARTKSITLGPTSGSMQRMAASGLPMGSYRNTTLMGIANPRTGEIGLQDASSDAERLDTLAHEIGHVAGWGEKRADEIGHLTRPLSLRDLLIKQAKR